MVTEASQHLVIDCDFAIKCAYGCEWKISEYTLAVIYIYQYVYVSLTYDIKITHAHSSSNCTHV